MHIALVMVSFKFVVFFGWWRGGGGSAGKGTQTRFTELTHWIVYVLHTLNEFNNNPVTKI